MSEIPEAVQSKCLAFGDRVSKADFKSKSFIALKEARESLYWIKLLHRNEYINDKQYESIIHPTSSLFPLTSNSHTMCSNCINFND